MILKILLSITCLATTAQAFILKDQYVSGPELCEQHKDELKREISKWVSVPVDYQNPEGEKTQIYTFTMKKFDPKLPSMTYFTGGPGGSSHSIRPMIDLDNFNVIFFEQRGISCSKPKTKELFLDPNFYSSENSARDVAEIMKAYDLKQISIYGQSYGTAPATIFASLFPDKTRALVIEGVIFKGGAPLWLSKRRDQMLQDFFNGLPKDMQAKILDLSRRDDIPHNWYSHVGRKVFFSNNAERSFRYMLNGFLAGSDESIKSFILNFYPKEDAEEEDFHYGDVMSGMLACQEMGASDSDLSMTTVFNENNKLVPDHDNDMYRLSCMPIGLTTKSTKLYSALNFPVKVPTTYFLGKTDSTTDINQGMSHYKLVAKAFKQALIMPKGGHLTNLGLLKDYYPCNEAEKNCKSVKQSEIQRTIFEEALMGTKINAEKIKTFNASGKLQWTQN